MVWGVKKTHPCWCMTSGAYTDPDVAIDLTKGLPDLRSQWIEARGDTEKVSGLSSEFGQQRAKNVKTAELQLAHIQNRAALSLARM